MLRHFIEFSHPRQLDWWAETKVNTPGIETTPWRSWKIANLHFLFIGKHVGNLPWVQDVIDIFHKSFIFYLCVRKQENGWMHLASCLPQNALEVFPPLHFAIALRNLNLNGKCTFYQSQTLKHSWNIKKWISFQSNPLILQQPPMRRNIPSILRYGNGRRTAIQCHWLFLFLSH